MGNPANIVTISRADKIVHLDGVAVAKISRLGDDWTLKAIGASGEFDVETSILSCFFADVNRAARLWAKTGCQVDGPAPAVTVNRTEDDDGTYLTTYPAIIRAIRMTGTKLYVYAPFLGEYLASPQGPVLEWLQQCLAEQGVTATAVDAWNSDLNCVIWDDGRVTIG